MKVSLYGALISVALAASPALGQEPAATVQSTGTLRGQVQEAPQAPVAVLAPVQQVNVLRAGTEIPLIMREELTTKKKKLRVGQRFQMEVSENVTSNGVVVIPSGTPAIGEITEVRNKGMWGKSGYIGARVVSLRLGDRHIRLTGNFDDKGVTGTGGVVAAVALVPIAGFFTTGTSAFIASGAGVKGFLDEDIAFRPVASQLQVIDVPVQASAASTPAASQNAIPAK
ncbi:hypothetical protein [Novosphingobium sp. KN65.2]|uniref:hypothetical protein n=1 Tax=Novosphingobium sp. KN65.2 TaxID=1478134 RepID=UPI000A9B3649|nr:hypothetical protein [Novosphingobium sp. KN65.2]